MDNIKVDLQEVGWGGMVWNTLVQEEGSCECDDEPSGSVKCREFLHYVKACLLLKDCAAWSSFVRF